MTYFGRTCQLLLVPAGTTQPQSVSADQSGPQTGAQASDVSGNRIRFSVQKLLGPATNRSHIEVWNLNADTRKALAKPSSDMQSPLRPMVYLAAGYRDTLAAICRGSILRCVNRHEPPDWVTELDVLTDALQTGNALVPAGSANQSPVAVKTLVDSLIAQLQWGKPLYTSQAAKILAGAGTVTFASNALVADCLTKVLSSFGLSWMIDDQSPVIYESRGALDPDTADAGVPVLSQATGVVGTPQVTETGVEICTLLTPSTRVGRRFRVDSPAILDRLGTVSRTQQYIATQVRHDGDTWGNEWTTWIEGAYFPYPELKTENPAPVPPYITVNKVS